MQYSDLHFIWHYKKSENDKNKIARHFFSSRFNLIRTVKGMVFKTGSNGIKGENEIKKLLMDELQNIASVKGRQL